MPWQPTGINAFTVPGNRHNEGTHAMLRFLTNLLRGEPRTNAHCSVSYCVTAVRSCSISFELTHAC